MAVVVRVKLITLEVTSMQSVVLGQSVLSGPEIRAHSHQLALDRLNFGVENESLY